MAKIGIIIPDEMREDIEWLASQEERNISWIVRKAIEEYLAKHIEYEEEKE